MADERLVGCSFPVEVPHLVFPVCSVGIRVSETAT